MQGRHLLCVNLNVEPHGRQAHPLSWWRFGAHGCEEGGAMTCHISASTAFFLLASWQNNVCFSGRYGARTNSLWSQTSCLSPLRHAYRSSCPPPFGSRLQSRWLAGLRGGDDHGGVLVAKRSERPRGRDIVQTGVVFTSCLSLSSPQKRSTLEDHAASRRVRVQDHGRGWVPETGIWAEDTAKTSCAVAYGCQC